jgi:hypothetical protein
MPGHHGGHHGGGWSGGGGGGYYYGMPVLAPDYAVVDYGANALQTSCNCANSSASGVFGGLESAVKANPMVYLLGAFALAWLLKGRKGF